MSESAKEDFIEDILNVCYQHNMFISHEDSQGGFKVVNDPDQKYRKILAEWFREAKLESNT